MEYTETLTRYISNFVDELSKSGVTDAVISPGSRSTPIAMTLTEHPDIKQWVIIDERSAAFFALGMAKKSGRPVAIVCTSGTAAANYFPAVVEAYYSRVPLVVLTADRPHELRDVGAPQAIGQLNLYGDYVKWFNEMAMPEADRPMLDYVRSKASRSIHVAKEGNSGPVQLNFPLREPLIPDFTLDHLWADHVNASYYTTLDGDKQLQSEQIYQLYKLFTNKKKGIIVCGPQDNQDAPEHIAKLAHVLGVPVLADPLSGLRSGSHVKENVIEGYDAFLRNKTIREELKPDYILRFGAMPVSKPYLFYVKQHADVQQLVVEEHAGYREPAGNRTEFIYADSVSFCDDIAEIAEKQIQTGWLAKWKTMNEVARKHLQTSSECNVLTEGDAVRYLFAAAPESSSIYTGNSMAIRDVDTFFLKSSKNLRLLGNRGANGIDGMVSSGLGAAAVSNRPVTILLGDLSFFHDMNGLLAAKAYKLNITILLINNNGGGIFSFLPQANYKDHFEALFGTPADLPFEHAVSMYNGSYRMAENQTELQKALAQSYQEDGLSVVEVQTDRDENRLWHQQRWQAIEEEITTWLGRIT